MGVRGAFLPVVLTAALVAGCGGSSQKPAVTQTTGGGSTAAISSHLLSNDELAGFTGASPTVASTASSWVTDNGPPPGGAAAEEARLAKLGFVRGGRDVYAELGPGGSGINLGFAKGTYAYVLGQILPSTSSYKDRVAKLVAAARHLYARVSP